MMETTYRVVLKGINSGIDPNEAKAKLAGLFKISREKLDPILISPQFVIKTGLPIHTAAKYHSAIEAAGGVCIVEPEREPDLEFELESLDTESSPLTQSEISSPTKAISKWDCPKCATHNDSSAAFCPVCGHKFSDAAPEIPTSTSEKTSQQKDPDTTLIKCSACGNAISRIADTCTKCGNPNRWVHANILAFTNKVKEGVSFTEGKFHCEHTKTTLKGHVDRLGKLQVALGLLALLFFAGLLIGIFQSHYGFEPSFSLAFVPLVIIFVLLALGGANTNDNKWFSVDFSNEPPVWSSNDEQFWSRVKKAVFNDASSTSQSESRPPAIPGGNG